MKLRFPQTKESFIILMVVMFGASAFIIFIMPAFLPEILHNDFYPVLTNMMGIFAILSAVLFLYWAYITSKKIRGQSRAAVQPDTKELIENNDHGEFIFCTECELIEGRANICKGCPKAGGGKNGFSGKKTF
ncbi:MAG: hypothetical protein N3F63_00665 [Thermoplasmata archaeon]|nr:hypothetical protein [Thermoplasmata archaeon]